MEIISTTKDKGAGHKNQQPLHLVALMALVSKHYSSHTGLNQALFKDDRGNVTVNDSKTSDRTFPFLDGLASICISKPHGQSVALAVQLCSKEHEIRLTMAHDGNFDKDIPQYLVKVWENLAALSHIHTRSTLSNRAGHGTKTLVPDSSHSQTVSERELKAIIFQDVYQWTMPRNQSLMHKFVPQLAQFLSKLRKYRGKGVHLQGLEKNLEEAFLFIYGVRRWFDKYTTDPDSMGEDFWYETYKVMDYIVENLKPVFADRVFCERLVEEIHCKRSR